MSRWHMLHNSIQNMAIQSSTQVDNYNHKTLFYILIRKYLHQFQYTDVMFHENTDTDSLVFKKE